MILKPDVKINQIELPAAFSGPPRKRVFSRHPNGMAETCFEGLEKGCEIFALTNGQFSMIDVLRHVLSISGPAEVCLATWTAADEDIRKAHAFLLDGKIRSIRFIVDPS